MCNSVKFETGWNLLPVLKIVTHTGHAAYTYAIVAKHVTGCSIFSNSSIILTGL